MQTKKLNTSSKKNQPIAHPKSSPKNQKTKTKQDPKQKSNPVAVNNKKTYKKPFLSIPKQIALLKSRGMVFNLRSQIKAEKDLSFIGYHRLSSYSRHFRKYKNNQITDKFQPNTDWGKIIELYNFDTSLRQVVMQATESAEIQLRAQIASHFSNIHTPYEHLKEPNPKNSNPAFNPEFNHNAWLSQGLSDFAKSNRPAAVNFKKTYDVKTPPIWLLLEAHSLGALSVFYSGLNNRTATKIAAEFAVTQEQLSDILPGIVVARNICAHHSELWSLNEPHPSNPTKPIRLHSVLLTLSKLLPPAKTSKWQNNIRKLIIAAAENYKDKKTFFKTLGTTEGFFLQTMGCEGGVEGLDCDRPMAGKNGANSQITVVVKDGVKNKNTVKNPLLVRDNVPEKGLVRIGGSRKSGHHQNDIDGNNNRNHNKSNGNVANNSQPKNKNKNKNKHPHNNCDHNYNNHSNCGYNNNNHNFQTKSKRKSKPNDRQRQKPNHHSGNVADVPWESIPEINYNR